MTRLADKTKPEKAPYAERFPFFGEEFFEKKFFGSSSKLTSW